MTYRYKAFGLCIESAFKMDELTQEPDDSRQADVRILSVDLGIEMKAMGEAPPYMNFDDPEKIVMVWPGCAAAEICGSAHVNIQEYPGNPETYIAFPILGPIMGWLLFQRGLAVFHSSAITIDNFAIAFMGDKGAGKSTTAAAFLQAGAELITDDLLVIDMKNNATPLIQPSFAQLKLEDSAIHKIHIPDAKVLPLVMSGVTKRQHRLQTMMTAPVPCDAFFVIHRKGNEPNIEWVDPGEGFQHLMRYSYNVRFDEAPVSLQARGRNFQDCVKLASISKIGILSIPHDIFDLSNTVEYVRQTMAKLSQ